MWKFIDVFVVFDIHDYYYYFLSKDPHLFSF